MSVRRLTSWIATAGTTALVLGLLGAPATGKALPEHAPRDSSDQTRTSIRIVDLAVPPGNGVAHATRISDRGVVIGHITDPEWGQRGFRWEAGHLLILEGLDGVPSPEVVVADVNSRGQVVGSSSAPDGGVHAVMWQPDGTIVDLGVPGQFSIANGINRRGTVAGFDTTPSGPRTTVWKDGIAVRLDDLGEGYTAVLGPGPVINDSGEVAGIWYTLDGTRAFRWDDGDVTVLPAPEGAETYPIAINRHGDLAAQVHTETGITAVVWGDDGELVQIPGLGGTEVAAKDLNDRGEVAGYAVTVDGFLHAFLYRNGLTTDLGTLGGHESAVNAINRRGQAVGYSSTTSAPEQQFARAVLWDDGGIIDLGTLDGGHLSVANDINNRGQIVGHSTDSTGRDHAVMWIVSRRHG